MNQGHVPEALEGHLVDGFARREETAVPGEVPGGEAVDLSAAAECAGLLFTGLDGTIRTHRPFDDKHGFRHTSF